MTVTSNSVLLKALLRTIKADNINKLKHKMPRIQYLQWLNYAVHFYYLPRSLEEKSCLATS